MPPESSGPAGWRSLAELGAVLLTYDVVERLLARRAAAWASLGEGGLAVRLLWGELGEEGLGRAEAWRALADDLAGPLLGKVEAGLEPMSSALAAALDALSPTVEARLGVVARAYLPRLATAYRAHRATASRLAEGPVHRQLCLVLPSLVSASEEAERLLEDWGFPDGSRLSRAMREVAAFEEAGSLARLLRPCLGGVGGGSAGASGGLLTAPLH